MVYHVPCLCTGSDVYCTQTGYVRVDDESFVYLDGVLAANTSDYSKVYSFTAPDDWQILAIHGLNNRGPKGIIASLGDDVYTDVTRWRCSSTYTPGWQGTGFDDCAWERPDFKVLNWEPSEDFNPGARHIWSATGGRDSYCRTQRLPEARVYVCDIPPEREHVFYRGIIPDGVQLSYELITTHTVIDMSVCSVKCTESATLCRHSNDSVCVPPDGGCCAFAYDDQDMSCDMYTIIPPCAASPLPDFVYLNY